jgi:hypothetical protein
MRAFCSWAAARSCESIREGKSPDDKKNSTFSTKFFANFHYFCVLFPSSHRNSTKTTAFHHAPLQCETTQWNHLLYFTAISCYASIGSMKFSGNPHNYCCYTWNYWWPAQAPVHINNIWSSLPFMTAILSSPFHNIIVPTFLSTGDDMTVPSSSILSEPLQHMQVTIGCSPHARFSVTMHASIPSPL